MAASIMIAEHSEIIRKGMLDILHQSSLFDQIREVHCAANLNEMVNRYKPDILIVNPAMIDINIKEKLGNGIDYTPKLAAVVYHFHEEARLAIFDEVIPINHTRAKIVKKLHSLLQKESAQTNQAVSETLTEREKDVLKLLVQGLSNKEVADKLFISAHTVMSHRKNISRKLNIKSLAGLTVYALLHHIVNLDELQR